MGWLESRATFVRTVNFGAYLAAEARLDRFMERMAHVQERTLQIEEGSVAHPFPNYGANGKNWIAVVTGEGKRGKLNRTFLPRTARGTYDAFAVEAYDVLEIAADFTVRGRTVKRREYWLVLAALDVVQDGLPDPGDAPAALALATVDPVDYEAACRLRDDLLIELEENEAEEAEERRRTVDIQP